MTKIPVGKTIAYAYSFAIGSFFRVLGLAWFPLVLMMGGGIVLLRPFQATLTNSMTSQDFTAVLPLLPLLIPFYLAVIVLLAMVKESVVREALGLRSGSAYFHFSLAPPVWRLIGAYILLILALIGMVLASIVAVGLLDLLLWGVTALVFGRAAGLGFVGILSVIELIAFYPAALYAGVRLSFLVAPIVVAENQINLRRGWRLMRGNFWRGFGIDLAVLLPISLVYIAILYAVVGANFLPPMHAGVTPEELNAWNRRLAEQFRNASLVLQPVYLIISLIMTGLNSGVSAYAYRALVPIEGIAAEFA